MKTVLSLATLMLASASAPGAEYDCENARF